MRSATVLLLFLFPAPLVLNAQQRRATSSAGAISVIQAATSDTHGTRLHWESQARLHHGMGAEPGRLALSQDGVAFRPRNGAPVRWPFAEIETFDLLNPRRLVVTDYENRRWHRHGDREFRFDLATPMPPGVAADLARSIGKPVRNGDPNPAAPSFADIPARQPTFWGGTNGTLRFGREGIEYLTLSGRGGRSWSWRDIETLANPDPLHLSVTGYRETFDFELKEPISSALFDLLWERLYARDFSGVRAGEGQKP